MADRRSSSSRQRVWALGDGGAKPRPESRVPPGVDHRQDVGSFRASAIFDPGDQGLQGVVIGCVHVRGPCSDLVELDVEVAKGSEDRRHPLQLAVAGSQLVRNRVGEERQGAADPAGGDAHVVHGLCIVALENLLLVPQ